MANVPNFTPRAQQALKIALEAAFENDTHVISINHLAYGTLSVDSRNIETLFIDVGVKIEEVVNYLLDLIDEDKDFVLKDKAETKPFVYSSNSQACLEISHQVSKNLDHGYIGVEHLLLSLSQYPQSPLHVFLINVGVDPNIFASNLKSLFFEEKQEALTSSEGSDLADLPQRLPESSPKFEFLAKFATNLNELAKLKKIDPVIGRESEIQEVCEILCKRKKSNPILLGDPGVGKTAVVEGLAHQIISAQAPEFLLNKIIYSLDMGLVVAGTKYRGQFEERLKNIIEEASSSDRVILFIDEIHTLIGAGSAEGTMDAANMLKPALSRGEIACIGATTFEEHKKTILKDGALDRRFQAVKVEEPSREACFNILQKACEYYKNFHGVTYNNDLINICINLADKYIGDKRFPDKALDLLDHAGSKAKISFYQRPQKAKDIEAKLESLMNQEDQYGKTPETTKAQDELFKKYERILLKWSGEQQNVEVHVSTQNLFEALAQRAKIPLESIFAGTCKQFVGLDNELKKTIIGQDHAVDKIYKSLLRGHTPLKNPKKPFGSFLCLGSTGVGKTFLAKSIAKKFFGSEKRLIQLDMSEYSDKVSTSKMVGSSPGYVGYEEGGQLTEKVKKNPYSVILFDEIEKADASVHQMLLQIMEEGHLTDNFGNEISFANSVIILTGNIGAHLISQPKSMGFLKSDHDSRAEVSKEAQKFFKPEFLNRIDEIIVFNPLGEKELSEIIKLEIQDLKSRLASSNIFIKIMPKVYSFLTELAVQRNDGARPVKKIIQDEVENVMAPFLIEGISEFTISIKKSKISIIPKKIKTQTDE
jgi:ATP-dependent Clp protease ATP-binding subunit ClpC